MQYLGKLPLKWIPWVSLTKNSNFRNSFYSPHFQWLPLLHLDVFWYHLTDIGTKKNVPKKVFVTLFLYIFHVKTNWDIAYGNLKTKIFSRYKNILPQMHWTSDIGVFWVSLNYPILNLRKTVCTKKSGYYSYYSLYYCFLHALRWLFENIIFYWKS